jgi:hypothetical protein
VKIPVEVTGHELTCPFCRAVVEVAEDSVLPDHARPDTGRPCTGSGWTIKGEHQ